MLDWHSCQICYPLEVKILLLLYTVSLSAMRGAISIFNDASNP